jgi:hypothetical protein
MVVNGRDSIAFSDSIPRPSASSPNPFHLACCSPYLYTPTVQQPTNPIPLSSSTHASTTLLLLSQH